MVYKIEEEMNGKGSKRRPMKITQKEFEENWERVFGKKAKPKEKKDE